MPILHPIPPELLQAILQHAHMTSSHFLSAFSAFFAPPEAEEPDPLTEKAILVWGAREAENRKVAFAEYLLNRAAEVETKQGERRGEALRCLLYMQTAGIKMTVGSFSHMMRVEHNTASGLLSALEEKGFLVRERRLGVSYREKYIVLTEVGEHKARILTYTLLHAFEKYIPFFQENSTTLADVLKQEEEEEL